MTELADRPSGPRDARRRPVPTTLACLLGVAIATAGCDGEDAKARVVPPPVRITVALPSAEAPITPLLFLLTQARLISVWALLCSQ